MADYHDSYKSNRIPEWLSSFAASFQCSADFIREMDQQLGKQFRDVTGLDLDPGFHLLNHFPEPFKSVLTETGYVLKGELVGHKMGYQVEIAWKGVSDGLQIRPEEWASGDEIRFWWNYLDAAEIVAEETGKSELTFDTRAFYFLIEHSLIVWPHLSLEIIFKNKLSENEISSFQDMLLETQQEWNPGKERGTIHQVRDVQCVNGGSLQVRIDFGSAGPDGLEFLLLKIAEKVKDIITIRISSY